MWKLKNMLDEKISHKTKRGGSKFFGGSGIFLEVDVGKGKERAGRGGRASVRGVFFKVYGRGEGERGRGRRWRGGNTLSENEDRGKESFPLFPFTFFLPIKC
jgi:hypothetical protein